MAVQYTPEAVDEIHRIDVEEDVRLGDALERVLDEIEDFECPVERIGAPIPAHEHPLYAPVKSRMKLVPPPDAGHVQYAVIFTQDRPDRRRVIYIGKMPPAEGSLQPSR